MDRKKLVFGLWIGTGVAAAGVAAYFGLKKAGLLGGIRLMGSSSNNLPGPVQTEPAPPPPLVSKTRYGDMELRLYRAPNIPIDQRVRLIQDRVWNGVNDPRIRKLALELTKGCGRNDGLCEAQKIYEAVKKRVRYTGDVAPVRHPDGTVEAIDYFQGPWRTWEFGGGDCDDSDGLILALTSVIGVPGLIRVTAPSKLSDWQHVYPVVGLPKTAPKKYVAVDVTLPGKSKFGDEARFGKNRDYVPYKDYAA